MRRRRQLLQVSTFPFLAVLLCAMGSLILMLLVLDRRARVVAQARALQAATHVAEEDAQAVAEREAEWERRRHALHQSLLEQEQELTSQAGNIEARIASLNAELNESRSSTSAMDQQVQAERDMLTRGAEAIQGHRAELARTTQQTEASRIKLAQLALSLGQLEKTLDDLKAVRRRQQQTYSLVPYRGRQGDHRRPIYIECTSSGVIFHPDRLAFEGGETTVAGFRAEVERRMAGMKSAEGSTSGNAAPAAYLLMLIRPDGIMSYHGTVEALRDLPLDFGYEMIERDWVLDFPADDRSPATQPWMTTPRTGGPNPRIAAAPERTQRTPVAGLPPDHANPPPPGTARSGTQGTGRLEQPSDWSTGRSPRTGGPMFGDRSGGQGADQGVGRASRPPGSPGFQQGPAFPGPSAEPGFPGITQVPAPSGAIPGRAAPGSVVEPGHSSQPVDPGASASSPATLPSAGAAPGSSHVGGTDSLRPPSPLGPSPAAKGRGGLGSTEPAAQGAADEPGEEEPSNPLTRLMPRGPLDKPVAPSAVRPLRAVISNRDMIIAIECTADALILYPARLRIPTAGLTAGGGAANPLVKAVQQMIDRRQASVPAGEPPYRPMIRFHVRPDGRRSYYLAFPTLEVLRLPMSRENLEAGEDLRLNRMGW